MAATLLNQSAIKKRLPEVPEWKHEGNAIAREFVFRNFREAVAFLVRIAFDAEEADHHPDVALSYKRLRLSLSTHSEGGLTNKDFDLASKIDRVFAPKA
jgi:4a-hydroxytetrahydrobiopterin dehydratase